MKIKDFFRHPAFQIILGIAILIIALIPRSVEILNGNYLFGFDQGRDYLAVKSLVVDHKLTLIGSEIGAGSAGFQGIFHGPFHYYFLAIPFTISNGDPYGGIILTFLYGIITLALGFLVGRILFKNVWGGFLVSLLIAISPPLISFSRFVWNTHGATVFIILAFYSVFNLCHKDKKPGKYIFTAAFFSGFIYNFQFAIAVSMSIALLVFILIMRFKDLRSYILLLLGYLTGFFPMILFEIRHGFIAFKGVLTYLSSSESANFTLLGDLKGHLGSFMFNIYDTFPRQNVLREESLTILLGVLVFYFLIQEKRKEIKKFILYLLLLPFITFIALSFLRNFVYQHYLIHLVLVYIILFSYIFFSAYNKKIKILKVGFTLTLTLFFIQSIPSSISTFKKDYFDYGGTAKIRGKKDAIDYIYRDASNKEFGLLVFSPPVYTYPYDYLIWWYGQKKYNYTPYNGKRGVVYLLIEQDPEKPWSYKGWLETVIKTGDLVYEKKLNPSGFIIQKRIFNE